MLRFWSKLVIDDHSTIAEYISDELNEDVAEEPEEWKTKQVVKCEDRLCCLPFRSSYLSVVKDRFLPPPNPVV